jgi:hypothetical protein
MNVFSSIFRKTVGIDRRMKEVAIHEAMFSGIYKLSEHPAEILLRIHPSRRQAYNSIVSRNATVRQNGEDVKVADVLLDLNSDAGIIRVS